MSSVVAIFAGDSGDGIQLLGNLFSDNVAHSQYSLKTFPDFPAEIRAPAGTEMGVSGFQISWGGQNVRTAGDSADILVAFNAAAFLKFKDKLKPSAVILYDPDGFDARNCKLAKMDLSFFENQPFQKIPIQFSALTKLALKDEALSEKERDQNKNLFALGVLNFAIEHTNSHTLSLLEMRFSSKPNTLIAMKKSLQQGFFYAETIELSIEAITHTQTAIYQPGNYRNIQGNMAISLALIAASYIYDRKVFFAGYPITPASDILHELSKHSFEDLKVVQAEDEIAAASMALGAAFGGAIAITASSGPGIDLKQETIALAHSAEMPMMIIDIMRAGPSTGMPTKLEQSDLEAVYYGRHGESIAPIVAISSPKSAFDTTLKAIEIMVKYQTPLFLLSDISIANGSEPWKLPEITKKKLDYFQSDNPFERSAYFTKNWFIAGQGKPSVVGGLEKDLHTGQISYDAQNHQTMTYLRQNKINSIAQDIAEATLEDHSAPNGSLIVSWGSTLGSVTDAVEQFRLQYPDRPIGHLHFHWLRPFPRGTEKLLKMYNKIIVVELNSGQLARILSAEFGVETHKINKIQGIHFFTEELLTKLDELVL